jgi:SAM-dependent methyltransferase
LYIALADPNTIIEDVTGSAPGSTAFGPQWEEASGCDLCGTTGWRPLGTIYGRRYGLCAGCGVVRLIDRVAESALGLLYEHYYKLDELSREELEQQLKNPTFAHRMKRLESMRESPERRLFEIGCGDGNFLAFMQRAGWKVDGSEFGGETVSLVRNRHGIAITHGDATKKTPPSAPYPVVAAYHVIEHVYQPSAWLRQVRTLIEPRGLLHLQTPNWDSLAHTLTGLAWSSMTFPQHVYLYTPKTLSALLPRFGLEVLSVTTWDPWHGPGAARGSLGNRAKQLATGRLPWSAALGPAGSGGGTEGGEVERSRAITWRGVSQSVLQVAGESVARLESLIGRGEVVDLIARRVD